MIISYYQLENILVYKMLFHDGLISKSLDYIKEKYYRIFKSAPNHTIEYQILYDKFKTYCDVWHIKNINIHDLNILYFTSCIESLSTKDLTCVKGVAYFFNDESVIYDTDNMFMLHPILRDHVKSIIDTNKDVITAYARDYALSKMFK